MKPFTLSKIIPPVASVLACSFSLLAWSAAPAPAQEIWQSDRAEVQSVTTVLDKLAAASVVYLGESHDNPADHAAQLQMIQALHGQNPQLAIALEMFQQPYQEVIDQYLAGEISETELREGTEYDQRWGFPWEYYAPILRYAREQDLPVVALNVPTEVTRQVAEKGLGSLSARDRQYIPPIDEIDTDNPAYREWMLGIFKDFHQGHGSSRSFDRFFLAQVLWDETMAMGIVNFLQEHPEHQVVVLAGQGHIAYGYGIPSRVARRLNQRPDQFPNWSQSSVLLNPGEDLDRDRDTALADYLWISEDTPEASPWDD